MLMKHLSDIEYYLIIESLIYFLSIIFILFYFLRKNTNPMVFIITLTMWFFNGFIIIILPFDIYLSNYQRNESKVIDLQNKIRILYSICYWSTSLTSSILIPLITQYESSGYFTKREKIIYSIKSNLKFYGLLSLLGIVLFVWAYFKLSQETKSYFLKNCFNFSYVYGFFFLVLLLGYSIPKLPLNIYEKIFYKQTIKNLENNAKLLKKNLDDVNKDLLDSYYKLVNIEEKIKINKQLKDQPKLESLDNIIKDKETEEKTIRQYEQFLDKKISYIKKNEKLLKITIKNVNLEQAEDFDMEELPDKIASLNIKLKENEWDNLRIQCKLQSIYNDWCYMKTIVIKGKKYKSTLIDQQLRESKLKLMGLEEEFIPLKHISKIMILYYMKIHPIILFLFSFVFFILGIIILLSELCIILPWRISVFSIINYWITNVFKIQVFIISSVLIFFFMSVYALMNFKLTKNYRVYGPRQTDGLSILYFTSNFCKITFPLSLNILIMMNHGDDEAKRTLLENDFGININNQIFVLIAKYSPLLLFFFVVLNMFGIFSKIIDCFSVETFSSLFSSNIKEEANNGYDYLISINKEKKGKLITDSIMDKIIEV